MKISAATALVFSGLAGGAISAQPIALTVDPAQSSLALTIEVQTTLASASDDDSSPIVGDLMIELTPTTGLTAIDLIDYSLAAQDTLNFGFNFGLLGSLSADGTGLGIRQPAGAPPASGTVDAADMFSIVGVPSEGVGVIDVTGSGVVGGLVGAQTIALTDLGASSVDASGTITVVGDQVTLSGSVPVSFSEEVQPGVTVVVTGTATVVATGTIPDDPCPADTNGDGALDPADFNAWVIAFNTQAPECDQNGDGLCNPADFNSWVINFNAGCD
ncbi:MAG: GC-type dockerin domain-anchored protein [Planctomycetota bacterium]